MSEFWNNNKDSFKKAGIATLKGTAKGTKFVGKTGYQAVKTARENERARKSGKPVAEDETGEEVQHVRPISSLHDPKTLPAPPRRNTTGASAGSIPQHQQYQQPQQYQPQQYQQPQQYTQQPHQHQQAPVYQQQAQQPQQPQQYQQYQQYQQQPPMQQQQYAQPQLQYQTQLPQLQQGPAASATPPAQPGNLLAQFRRGSSQSVISQPSQIEAPQPVQAPYQQPPVMNQQPAQQSPAQVVSPTNLLANFRSGSSQTLVPQIQSAAPTNDVAPQASTASMYHRAAVPLPPPGVSQQPVAQLPQLPAQSPALPQQQQLSGNIYQQPDPAPVKLPLEPLKMVDIKSFAPPPLHRDRGKPKKASAESTPAGSSSNVSAIPQTSTFQSQLPARVQPPLPGRTVPQPPTTTGTQATQPAPAPAPAAANSTVTPPPPPSVPRPTTGNGSSTSSSPAPPPTRPLQDIKSFLPPPKPHGAQPPKLSGTPVKSFANVSKQPSPSPPPRMPPRNNVSEVSTAPVSALVSGASTDEFAPSPRPHPLEPEQNAAKEDALSKFGPPPKPYGAKPPLLNRPLSRASSAGIKEEDAKPFQFTKRRTYKQDEPLFQKEEATQTTEKEPKEESSSLADELAHKLSVSKGSKTEDKVSKKAEPISGEKKAAPAPPKKRAAEPKKADHTDASDETPKDDTSQVKVTSPPVKPKPKPPAPKPKPKPKPKPLTKDAAKQQILGKNTPKPPITHQSTETDVNTSSDDTTFDFRKNLRRTSYRHDTDNNKQVPATDYVNSDKEEVKPPKPARPANNIAPSSAVNPEPKADTASSEQESKPQKSLDTKEPSVKSKSKPAVKPKPKPKPPVTKKPSAQEIPKELNYLEGLKVSTPDAAEAVIAEANRKPASPPPPAPASRQVVHAPTVSKYERAAMPVPQPPPSRKATGSPAPPPPPPSRNVRSHGGAGSNLQTNDWKPTDLDLELGSGWFAKTSSFSVPKCFNNLTYTTSLSISDNHAARIISARFFDLSVAKIKIEWDILTSFDENNPSKDQIRSLLRTVKIDRIDIPPPSSPSEEVLISNSDKFGDHVANWAETKLGQKVGNGECWTLAHDALQKGCGNYAYVSDAFNHGAKILTLEASNGSVSKSEQLDEIRRGDIIQYKTCIFKTASSIRKFGAPDHTSIVLDVKSKGADSSETVLEIAHQNANGVRNVTVDDLNLSELNEGTLTIFRPIEKEWAGELNTEWKA